MSVLETTSKSARSLKDAAQAGKDVRVNLARDVYVDKSENVRAAHSYDDQSQQEMVAQIEATGGILQPLAIAPIQPSDKTDNKSYILVDGYRRALALLELSAADPKWVENVPARVMDEADSVATTRIMQLIYNTHKDLNPMEKAVAIKEALDDKSCDFSQRDIAKLLNLSDANVSQLLKLLRFPKEIQDMISTGKLSFSHARVILEKAGEDQWMHAATLAVGKDGKSGMLFDDFKDKMEEIYGPKDEAAADGTTTTADGKTSTQKPAKMLRATEISGNYSEFIKKRVAEADASEKAFTAKDVEQARLDTLNTIMLNKETVLAKAIEPFLAEQAKKEEEEKAKGEAEKKEESFYKKQVKRFEELMAAPADLNNPNAPRPTAAQCYGTVAQEVYSLNEEAKKAIGFTLPEPDVFVKKLAETAVEVRKEREEDKKKRDEKKAKEAAEAKAKADAEAAAKGAEGAATAPPAASTEAVGAAS